MSLRGRTRATYKLQHGGGDVTRAAASAEDQVELHDPRRGASDQEHQLAPLADPTAILDAQQTASVRHTDPELDGRAVGPAPLHHAEAI